MMIKELTAWKEQLFFDLLGEDAQDAKGYFSEKAYNKDNEGKNEKVYRYFYSLILSYAFGQENIETKEIEVAIGIDQTFKLDYKFNTRVEVGNPNILSVVLVPAKQEVTFKGLRKGRTSVTFRNTLGERKTRFIVSVTADELSKTVADLRELLADVEGLEIGIKGGRVYVGGQIVVPTDIGKIDVVLGENNEVIRLYELHPQTQELIARKMQEEISKNGMKNVTVRVVNRVYWVEGVIASEGQEENDPEYR